MLDEFDFLIRLLVATGLGAVIGFERQVRRRAAGLRTTALVSVGSAMFVTLSYHFQGMQEASPSRIEAGIVTGIGFLGAGVIFREGDSVSGLTTAATIWCAAAIGTLAGAGLMLMSLYGALVIVGINAVLRPLSLLVDRFSDWRGDGMEDTGSANER